MREFEDSGIVLFAHDPTTPLFEIQLGLSEDLLRVFEKRFVQDGVSLRDDETFRLALRYLASLYGMYSNTAAFPSALMSMLPNTRGMSASQIADWIRGAPLRVAPRRRKELLTCAHALVLRVMRSALKQIRL